MTALDASAEESSHPSADVAEAPAATGALAGDPTMLGLPTFIVGSVALGLALVGVVPAGVLGAPLAIILAATGAGLTLAAIWAAAIGQSAVAAVFGIFAGFWLSYAGLVLGLLHNWFAIPATAVQSTVELFLSTWLILIVMLTLATLRLPVAFTAVFTLIDVALVFLLIGTAQTPTSTGMYKTAGVFVLAFAAVGMYVFFSSASVATGGKPLPLGRPIMR
jgi:succinate-acetate transporter protein